jgi:predicted DNA-binding transcriptional regulator AlpA
MIVSSDKRRGALRLPTLTEITTEWPATVDVAEAGAAFGLSRSYAYELVARGEFPAKAIRVGSRHRVITASIIRALSDGTAS